MAKTLAQAEAQLKKSEAKVAELEKELADFRRSPYFLSYVTILSQVNDFCGYTEKPLDINNPENKEAFNMRWKFIQELPTLLTDLDSLREKMTPQQQAEAAKIKDGSVVEIQVDKWKRKH
jgi:hypothetical protein